QDQQRLVVLGEQVVPRRRRLLGELPQRRVRAEPELHRQRLGGGGALDLQRAQLVEDDLDLVRDAGQPARLARQDQVLLLLGLEQQQVEQLLLAPEQRRQVLVVHALHRLPLIALSTGASARRPRASSRNPDTNGWTVHGSEEICRRRCDEVANPPRRTGVRPARALATDRPGPRTPNERRSAADVDALVTEHLPLAHFAVNAVASRI